VKYEGIGLSTDRVPLVAGGRYGTLPNGMRYYILPNTIPDDKAPINKAYIALVVNTGISQEKENGAAYFVQNIILNNTHSFSKSNLQEYFKSLGITLSIETNTELDLNKTVYHFEVPVIDDDDKKIIPEKVISILNEWSSAANFQKAIVDEQREIVIAANNKAASNPAFNAKLAIDTVLYADSHYAPHINKYGDLAAIEKADGASLEQFYRAWYRPDNMAVILVGNFDPDWAETVLPQIFTAPAGKKPFDRTIYEITLPKNKNTQAVIFKDEIIPEATIQLYYKQKPKVRGNNIGAFRESIIDDIIASLINVKANSKIAESDTSLASINYEHKNIARSSGFFIIDSTVNSAVADDFSVSRALNEILQFKEILLRFRFNDAEIEWAKSNYIKNLQFQIDNLNEKEYAQQANLFVDNFTQNIPAAGAEWKLNTAQKLLSGITKCQINEKLKSYFSTADVSILITANNNVNVPSIEDVKRIVKATSRLQLKPLNFVPDELSNNTN
jgi:zinc protease